MLLSVKKRKEFLRELGYSYTSKDIKRFQKCYFTRSKDIDGKYGKNTDILLRHCYNVQMYAPHFRPEEFKCECGGRYCTGYPTWMKKDILVLIEGIRLHYGKPVTVTCGLRCKRYNAQLNGSIANSLHCKGRAIDFYQAGVTDTLQHRKRSISWIKKQKNCDYIYGDGINVYGNHIVAPYMGNALHVDIGRAA